MLVFQNRDDLQCGWVYNHDVITGDEVSVAFIAGQVFINFVRYPVGGNVARDAGANAHRKINAFRFYPTAYQNVVNAGTLPPRNVQLALAFIALSPCAITSILKAPLAGLVAVTPILVSPIPVPIELTFCSIPSFLAETFLSATAALVIEALPTFRALLATFSAAASLVVEAFLPFRALLASFFATTSLVVEVFVPFRALLGASLSTARFIGAIALLGPLVGAPLRFVSVAHICVGFLFGG